MFVDLHICPQPGAERESMEECARMAKAAGLDAIVIFSRDDVIDQTWIDTLATTNELRIFVGVEVPSDEGTLLLYPPSTEGAYAKKAWQQNARDGVYPYAQIQSFCQKEGWAIVAAQPYQDDDGMGDHVYDVEDLHGIEVATQHVRALARDLAMEAAQAKGLPAFGASGPLNGSPYLNLPHTAFLGAPHSQEELVEALQSGNSWIISSPHTKKEQPPRSGGKRRRGRRGGKKKKTTGSHGE